MFRKLSRKNKELVPQECIKILTEQKRGVLSVIGDGGYPYGMPMNHFYNPEDGCIYFHCGKTGHRLDALKDCNKVSFCVFDQGYRKQGEWALNIKSVIVFGAVEVIDHPIVIKDISYRLSKKFTLDEQYITTEIQKFLPATIILKLTPEHICGKEVNEA